MAKDQRDLLQVLRVELDFLENGGYRKSSWRPQFVFEDSPSCLNYHKPLHSARCSDCVLMRLVPPEHRKEQFACRHIQLNEQGETIDSLYRTGTNEELETVVAEWLRKTIRELELKGARVQSG